MRPVPKQEPMDEEASSHHDLLHRRLRWNRLSSDLSSKKLIEALFCIRRSHFTPIYSCFRLRRTGMARCVKGYWQGCAGPWDPRGKDFRFSLTRQAPNFVVHFSLCLATGSPKPTALELRGRDSALWRSRADRARLRGGLTPKDDTFQVQGGLVFGLLAPTESGNQAPHGCSCSLPHSCRFPFLFIPPVNRTGG